MVVDDECILAIEGQGADGLFEGVGIDRGGERAAAIYTRTVTAKLNDIDPETWLADVLRSINDHPASRIDELLAWNWKKPAADNAEAV
jgi:hypothetical protein